MKLKNVIYIASELFVLLSSFNIQAQSMLPASVRQFLDERALNIRASERYVRFFPPRVVDGKEMVDAFIAIDNDVFAIEQLQAAGVIVNCCFDGFVTAQIPVDNLVTVSLLPCVTDVEISRNMTLCTDSTLSATHAGMVIDGVNNGLPQSYDGTGVIVGILDVGFDYQHLAFRRSDDPSRTRIVRVYSTTDRSGHIARFNRGVRLPGSVFIDDEVYALTTDDKDATHGTHTAGIAVGAHVNGYGGTAPGADIVLCALSVFDGNISATEIANCLRYVHSYADSVGKPCVISMSLNSFSGPHDGKDYLANVVSQLMGPGRLFVFAAGNNAGLNAYSYKNATPENPFNLLFKYNNSNTAVDSTYNYRLGMADIWIRSSGQSICYKYHFLDQWTGRIVWESDVLTSTSTIDVSEFSDYFTFDNSVDSTGYLKGQLTYSVYGKKYELSLTLRNLINKEYTTEDRVKKGRYAIGVSIWGSKGGESYFDAWTCNSGSGFSQWNAPLITLDYQVLNDFYSPPSDSCTINSHAVCDSIISVGAYVGRNSYYSLFRDKMITYNSLTVGDIASFSSYQAPGMGPSGKALPTVCAPGCYVVSAVSRYSSYTRSNNSMTVMKTTDGHYWAVMSGTSTAAPAVAGILAQWLQAKPDLSVAEAKEIMAETAIRDEFTQGPHAAQFGECGKIDALAGMKLILKRLNFMVGDVNMDGEINMGDVVDMIDYVIGNLPETSVFDKLAADVNQDGIINVADIVELIDIIIRS